ncbi:MAG: globin domain-containing protein [Methyloceanibacter sp.]|nr:globin domain-containing protein [Methyloceanibacter sp.]
MATAVLATTNSRVSRKTWHRPKSAKTGRWTKTQKRLIRESFKRVESASDLVAALFYLRLYQLDPSLQALFKGRRKAQRRELMGALKLAIISLDHTEELTPVLKLLGARHRHYGVRSGDYVTFVMAWIWTLEQSLEGRFTPESREAWMALLSATARTMAA